MSPTPKPFALLTLLLGALAEWASPPALAAQQAPPGTPLFLAIPETFPVADARVVVVREPDREVIVLRATEATPEALATALGPHLVQLGQQRVTEGSRRIMRAHGDVLPPPAGTEGDGPGLGPRPA